MCDYGFNSLILYQIEENKVSCDDLPAIQPLRVSYIYSRSKPAPVLSNLEKNPYRAKSVLGSVEIYTSTCTKGDYHLSNCILYNHTCSFCNQSSVKYSHTEIECKNQQSIRAARETTLKSSKGELSKLAYTNISRELSHTNNSTIDLSQILHSIIVWTVLEI